MMKLKVIISKFNNDNYVFEYKDGQCVRLYKCDNSQYRVGVILIGKIKDVKYDLNCCFVDMGDNNVGYLSFDDCNPNFVLNRTFDGKYKQGDEILVKITRMPSKNKPFSLSMYVDISGRYSVVSTKGNGYFASQKLSKVVKEELLSKVEKSLEKCSFDSLSCLLRTNSAKADLDIILDEIKSNKDKLEQVINSAKSRKVFSIMYKPLNTYINRILENDTSEIEEVITDNSDIFEEIKACNYFDKVTLYNDPSMAFNVLYNLDKAFNNATSRVVNINCGGFLVIEPTEALTVIDVNSGKYSGKKKSTDLINNVNKEAAIEIAKQLMLRNISGIVVVDFINCDKDEEKELLSLMKALVKEDKVKTVVEDFTKLGLMEITRQKIYPSIYDK